MKFLVKNLLILDKRSPFYQRKIDVEFQDGRILRIGDKLTLSENDTQIIQGNHLILSTAFVDINSCSGEPYRLEAETLQSLIDTSARGGYGFVAHMPPSDKWVQNKSDIAYLQHLNTDSICQVLPIGNLTKSNAPNTLSSMMDMKKSGAIAFSDGNEVMPKLEVLQNAFLYSKGFDGRIMVHPEKKEMSKNGQVNQGKISLNMGFKGIPKEAEMMAVNEVIQLAQYTDTNILFLNISCQESIQLIQKANKARKQFWISSSTLHIALEESSVEGYDTNFKINPPLRSQRDRKALIKAAQNNEIDILYSQHTPLTTEEKILEFDLAKAGAINAQTAVISTLETLGREYIETCIALMSSQPAAYLGIELPIFDTGALGHYTILDLESKEVFEHNQNLSLSKNSPFLGSSFSSKIIGLIAHGQMKFYV